MRPSLRLTAPQNNPTSIPTQGRQNYICDCLTSGGRPHQQVCALAALEGAPVSTGMLTCCARRLTCINRCAHLRRWRAHLYQQVRSLAALEGSPVSTGTLTCGAGGRDCSAISGIGYALSYSSVTGRPRLSHSTTPFIREQKGLL
jgi:hypothetical protein